jgi:bifunctional non-homologous end joining protein LigD
MNPAYRPMLATLVDESFDDKAWVFETKWDGFRLITEKRGDTVRLWSRNGIDATTRYAVLLPALQKIQGSCVIDGLRTETGHSCVAQEVRGGALAAP